MTRSTRIAGLTAALTAAVVSLAGCDTSPGAAALVGDQRISVETLQQVVNRALANPSAAQQLGGDRAGFTRNELGRLVTNRVVAAAAATYGITVTETDIDNALATLGEQYGGLQQLTQQAAAAGVPAADLRSVTRYYVLEQKLGAKLVADEPVSQADLRAAYQQNIGKYDTVHAAHILVKTKALADTILAQVKRNPSSFAALAKRYSTDTSNKNSGGDLGTQPQDRFVKSFGDAVFAAKAGSFIEVHSEFGYHVVHVIAHTKVPLAEAAPELRSSLLQNKSQTLLNQALTKEARKLGVHINPRYGRFDFSSLTVVAPSDKNAPTSPSPTASP